MTPPTNARSPLRVTIRQIEGFLAAADCLSFSRAAERLNMTQPAFSQLIHELEQSLGLRLFDRTTRRVQVTDAGRRIAARMGRGLLELRDACDEAQAIARVEQGHLAAGVLQSLAVGVMARALGEFKHSSPAVTVALFEDFNGALIDGLVAGNVDFAVCARPETEAPISFEPLFTEALGAVLSDRHRLADRPRLTWASLKHEPLILTRRNSSTRAQVDKALIARGLDTEPAYEVANMFTALEMARAGLGITVLPYTVLREVSLAHLRTPRLYAPSIVRVIGVATRPDRTLSPAAQKLIGHLRALTRSFDDPGH